MKRQILRMLCLMITMIMFTALLPVHAETHKDDGAISIIIHANNPNHLDFKKSDICVKAYQVASGDYGGWTMLPEFDGIDVFAEHGDDGAGWIQQSLDAIKAKIDQDHVKCTEKAKTDEAGQAELNNLPRGIYYIMMTDLPKYLTLQPMLVAVPDAKGHLHTQSFTKGEYTPNPKFRGGGGFTDIDDYETALGLGNIQIHVGVCFE